MSVKVTTWVWEHSASRGPARLVLLAIADNAHDDGAQAWPSITTLVRKTGLAERTVQVALNALQAIGELQVDHNAGPRHCNLYRILMLTPAGDAPPHNMHPAGDAGVQEMHPTPAGDAPLPPQEMHPEPSIEPSRNRQVLTPLSVVPTDAAVGDTVSRVWQAWIESCGADHGGRRRLTPKRKGVIRARLREYPTEDVEDAARGWPFDPWPERVNHNDLTVLLRNGEQLEKFRDLYRHGPPAVMGKHTSQTVAFARQMATMRPAKEVTADDVGRMDGDRALAQRQLSRPEG